MREGDLLEGREEGRYLDIIPKNPQAVLCFYQIVKLCKDITVQNAIVPPYNTRESLGGLYPNIVRKAIYWDQDQEADAERKKNAVVKVDDQQHGRFVARDVLGAASSSACAVPAKCCGNPNQLRRLSP